MPILTALKSLTDTRRTQSVVYEMHEIVFVALLAVLSGANSYRRIYLYINEKQSFLEEAFDIKWKKPPAYTTIRNVLLAVDEEELKQVMREHVKDYLDSVRLTDIWIAIDGKSIRRSFDNIKDKQAAHMLNVFVTTHNLIVAQQDVRGEKTNEIPIAQQLVEEILPEFKQNTVCTLDALHTQALTMDKIIESGSHFVMQVKANQPKLLKVCQQRSKIRKTYTKVAEKDKQHGRIEHRITTVYQGAAAYDKHPMLKHVKVIIHVRRIRSVFNTSTKQYERGVEDSYYVSSKELDASTAAKLIRGHWSIENSLHNVLDNAFGEDMSRIRVKPAIFSLLRNISLNVLRMNGVENISAQLFKNAVNTDNLLNLKYLY